MTQPAAQPDTPIIQMRNVAVGALRDQTSIVVKEVNWTVAPGDFWVVAGLQGAGKSDFLLMTGGLMPPAEGEYRLFGELMPIFDDARLPHRLRMGLTFEGGQLFNHLTIAENIALPLQYHRDLGPAEARAEIQPLLEGLELGEWADSTPGAMGRNWQKRAGLARALALSPELLLVDSPLTGLDLRHAQWWLNFLDRLSQGHSIVHGRSTTLVVTSADLQPWKGRARQFAVLGNKKLSVLGSWEQVSTARADLLQEVLTTLPQNE
jgi:ABC-type transporter Mla maintaining outer membrane lipid asymmetry ATPase subunit MlaF